MDENKDPFMQDLLLLDMRHVDRFFRRVFPFLFIILRYV